MANTLYVATNPNDGDDTYQKILLERAPDSGGAPGAFAQITSFNIDPSNEFTLYTDMAGTSTDWYRHRWANTGLTLFSDYSSPIIAGDYIIRQWIKADIADADLTNSDWDRWRDEILADLSVKYIGRPIYPPQEITPATLDSEFQDINAEIRRVLRVDIYQGGHYVTTTPRWNQWGRKLRLEFPQTGNTYKVFGIGFLRNLGDVDYEIFMLIYWGMRLRYIDKRLAERANFKYFLTADKVSDVDHEQLQRFRDQAQREFDSRLLDLRQTHSLPNGAP